jgi:hypothetical protein
MVASFGINVVSPNHAVVCGRCDASAQCVGTTCPQCGAELAESGFRIVARATRRPRRPRAVVRPAASFSY